jgi:hypothetical protein
MRSNITTYLPYLLSILTIYMMLLAGDNKRSAWAVGLFNQTLWFVWMNAAGAWGFAGLNIVLTAIYIRNYRKSKPL